MSLPTIRNVIAESLRLYPEPPLLIRRALVADNLPQGGSGVEVKLPKGADVFIATWNIHRSPKYWKVRHAVSVLQLLYLNVYSSQNPHTFDPDRFSERFENPDVKGWGGFDPSLVTGLYPGELAADFAFLPFGGGSRKCVGDQFALMESVVTLAVLLRRYEFTLTKSREEVGMRTGATIHTATGLHVRVRRRTSAEKNGLM
jgi:cytochrome P450